MINLGKQVNKENLIKYIELLQEKLMIVNILIII